MKNGFEVILRRLWAFKPSMIMRRVQTSGNMSLTYFPWRKDSGAIRITKKSPQWNLWLVSALVPIVHWVDWSYYSQVWDWESLARFPSPEGGTDHLSLDTQGRRATTNTRDQKSLKKKNGTNYFEYSHYRFSLGPAVLPVVQSTITTERKGADTMTVGLDNATSA